MLQQRLRFILLMAFAFHWPGALAKASKEVREHHSNSLSGLAEKELVFTYRDVSGNDFHRHNTARRPEAREVFLQRSTMRRQHRRTPSSAEDMDTILGVPKIVWVILCD